MAIDEFDLKQLRHFVAVADAGNFTHAAQSLYLSQQALSYSVKRLEESLGGGALFARSRLGVELTPAGQEVYDQAQKVLGEADELSRLFSRLRSGMGTSLSVGIHPLCFQRNGGTLTGALLLDFQERYPQVEFLFSEMDNNSIQSGVLNGSLDFGIGIAPLRGAEGHVLYRFPMAAVLPASSYGNRFAGKQSVTPADLAQERLITFTDDSEFNSIYLECAAREGINVEVASIRTSSSNAAEDVLAGRDSYIIKPLQHALRTINSPDVRIIPITSGDHRPLLVPLRVFWRERRLLAVAERALTGYIEELYETSPHA